MADHSASIVRNQNKHLRFISQPALADSIKDLLGGLGLHIVEAKLFEDGDNFEMGGRVHHDKKLVLALGVGRDQSVVSMPTACVQLEVAS